MKIPTEGIAFFDSGIGGLTVLAECRKRLPNMPFYYYGDNARAPYGNLSAKKIFRYTDAAFRLFRRLNVQAVVIACNTVTAVCVKTLRQKYAFPIIGAEPAVFPAARKGGEIFILTTKATHQSEKFQALCQSARAEYPQANVCAFSCDSLAGEIEKHICDKAYDFTALLPRGNPTSVVLGCTHYIYIKEAIRKFYGCDVMDGNQGIAEMLCKKLLKANEKVGLPTDFIKNRDGQPRLTTPLKGIASKWNKYQPKRTKSCKISTKQGEIFFLGKCGVVNKTQYEQMFV